MAGKYQTTIDLNNKNNSHTLTIEFVGQDKEVLDVGTATGYVARALAQRGCRVTGIELDPEAAKQAEEHCERVIVGDVESLDLGKELGGASFDAIVFGDLLEHLKDPLETLQRFKAFLRPEGYVVASIPNIAHGSVRLALMEGRFQYRPLGLLDNTHLRFFTRESVEQLFNDAGFLVDELGRVKLGIFDTEIEVDRTAIAEEVLEMVRSDPESETYQFVVMAHPADRAGGTRAADRSRLHAEQLARRDRMIYDLNRKVRNLDDLQQRLDRRDDQLATKRREVRDLAEELANQNLQLTRIERQIRRLEEQVELLHSEKE